MIGNVWIAIMEGEPLPSRSYNHVAFKVSENDLDMYIRRINEIGVEIKQDRSRIEDERKSVYFYDHDNHLFEIHAGTLDQRLALYRKS